MPRSKVSSKRSHRPKREYHSPQELPIDPSTIIGQAMIPQFRSQLPYRKSFRFNLSAAVGASTAFTTTMMLDMYAIAVGGSASPVRIYNNMKLLGVKLWQPGYETANDGLLLLEFSPSLTAGFGGAPRVPYTASSCTTGKMAHICARPKPNELASQWFCAQQAVYTLFNIAAYTDTILQLDFLVVEVNGETPVTVAYTSAVAKGTIGVTNFGVAGCRSIGLENLVNP